ncbi:hypothetical protein BAY60_07210 [Prauserella muralis]|uniref:Uncharacterized protein n=1 Tax=Prauserella muralis TaxID=588067 RepID=A0A2V4BE35_9PSEU|nr:hypothetical protein BAY60_07210 [Prauserella muralis]TWE13460.1 hypothetical protein FHX69_5583 [Prauserella muralis]
MKHRYRAHGLDVASEVELPLPPAPLPQGVPDLVLRHGEGRPVPGGRPPGRLLAELTGSDGVVFYSLGTDGQRTTLRYPALCEFTGDAGLAEVTARLHPGTDPGLLPVLAAGTLLAVRLMLRHHLVLHASAVQRDGRALAFVGASGMGKSTLAAALCGHGCGLVADDVLRVDRAGGELRVYPGSTESRLRTSARGLAETAPPSAVRPTADGRLALRPRVHADGPLPLAACVVPRPSRDAREVSVVRLPPSKAFLRLTQFPRVLGWRDPASMDRSFQALADLVERVPVFDATIPWGPPFRDDVLTDLLTTVT